MDEMNKKLDYVITLLGGKGQTPTKDQVHSKEKMEDDMEVDGAKINDEVVLDIAEEQLLVVVGKSEEKGVHEHSEAQVNVDVWKGEEIGVREHFEAQMHVDDKSDDEGNTPAEKVIKNHYLSFCLLFF